MEKVGGITSPANGPVRHAPNRTMAGAGVVSISR